MTRRIAVEATIHGRVQGVWYRSWTEQEARQRRLAGWVRNNADGTVSALFVGQAADVQLMLRACEDGPIAARVTQVEASEIDPVPDMTGFTILR